MATESCIPSAPADAETVATPSIPSAISELQEALGSILLARRDKSDHSPILGKHPYTVRRGKASERLSMRPIVYKWTGAFELFSFPRELRDRIFYYYLHRPNGVVYKRNTIRTFPFDKPEDIANLFLVSRQVHEEAFQVFCRNQIVEIGSQIRWNKGLEGTLRLFPDKPARMLQRVRRDYHNYPVGYSSYHGGYIYQKPEDGWVQMLRDAYTFKSFFPKLREYTAGWKLDSESFEQHKLGFGEKSEEEKVQIWLDWMRVHVKESNVVPPRWLRFEFSTRHKDSMQPHESAMNEAYVSLLRETAVFRDEAAELEESGKKWLEKTWPESKKQKRSKRRQAEASV